MCDQVLDTFWDRKSLESSKNYDFFSSSEGSISGYTFGFVAIRTGSDDDCALHKATELFNNAMDVVVDNGEDSSRNNETVIYRSEIQP